MQAVCAVTLSHLYSALGILLIWDVYLRLLKHNTIIIYNRCLA